MLFSNKWFHMNNYSTLKMLKCEIRSLEAKHTKNTQFKALQEANAKTVSLLPTCSKSFQATLKKSFNCLLPGIRKYLCK